MSSEMLMKLVQDRRAGKCSGIVSVCSAHPLVIEAAFRQGLMENTAVLIEATCNQVNHRGGYTGMTPEKFRIFVEKIARQVSFPVERIIMGGDHLGPNPWKNLSADAAMTEARAMVEAYAKAGFTKLHLDTSMGCSGEPIALSDSLTASRAAMLAKVAEDAVRERGTEAPVYVIGTEVPVPGGALEAIDSLEVTKPDAAIATLDIHRRAFEAAGLSDAFIRVIAAVVQPGVEFGNENVIVYDREKAQALSASLDSMPIPILFEAHSTDYQPEKALAALVQDGFAILKVGPGLTFALREALYGLDHIAIELQLETDSTGLRVCMEKLMLREPEYWQRYYHGSDQALRIQRHFSYSDRIRYYWTHPDAMAAVSRLFGVLEDVAIPETLISQYLARVYPQVMSGQLVPAPRELVIASVQQVLAEYAVAVG
ncbi:D-tagatose-bisphosphate aldolase, class II, non-catalytic subunit [Novacetimonas hansenii]|uniref:D-tagatose-bisphosphate aldolase, class II, non-catalytic subunit n=1 Tax=Novacetimonas hansenii TaxID=436 RepID=A0AAW5ETH2_NOVHA|nr:D-tagatose-bisphosphate aldolase, class II, non-catalytic subunit [Novacetimonas hansenii]MCJ8354620.1 D-tagatose-bisphosphate aldolase, class II, non-catalytic subunit [Novacetimonas hansenii]